MCMMNFRWKSDRSMRKPLNRPQSQQSEKQEESSDLDVPSMVKLGQALIGQKRTKEAMGIATERIVEGKLLAKGFLVSKPTLSCAYDLICDSEGHINTLQVRSSRSKQTKCNRYKDYYRFSTKGLGGYTILVLYVVPTDTLYFIPWHQLFGHTHNINIPVGSPSKYDPFKENYTALAETH